LRTTATWVCLWVSINQHALAVRGHVTPIVGPARDEGERAWDRTLTVPGNPAGDRASAGSGDAGRENAQVGWAQRGREDRISCRGRRSDCIRGFARAWTRSISSNRLVAIGRAQAAGRRQGDDRRPSQTVTSVERNASVVKRGEACDEEGGSRYCCPYCCTRGGVLPANATDGKANLLALVFQ
jgi:hypothetical protein